MDAHRADMDAHRFWCASLFIDAHLFGHVYAFSLAKKFSRVIDAHLETMDAHTDKFMDAHLETMDAHQPDMDAHRPLCASISGWCASITDARDRSHASITDALVLHASIISSSIRRRASRIDAHHRGTSFMNASETVCASIVDAACVLHRLCMHVRY